MIGKSPGREVTGVTLSAALSAGENDEAAVRRPLLFGVVHYALAARYCRATVPVNAPLVVLPLTLLLP